MKITAGTYRGRRLAAPKGDATRPTSDRVRQAIFNILTHGIEGFDLEGAQVLDLFAGTGALGLEAMSRGAKGCTFIDVGTPARAALRENIETLGVAGTSKLLRRDATDLGFANRIPPAQLVFLDPPYRKGLVPDALRSAVEGGWVSENAICVIEEATRSDIALPTEFTEIEHRRYGDTEIMFARYSGPTK